VYSSDKQRQAFSLFTMIAIAIIVISMLVVFNYTVYSPILTTSLIAVNITLISGTFYFIKTAKLEMVALISMCIVFIMCVALTYTGGKENTALYWLMFYPVVCFASLGVKHGCRLGLGLLLCCSVILYGPDFGQVNYGGIEKSRFLASFTLVFIFSFIGEYFRHKSHLAIADITLAQTQDAYTDQLTGGANRRFITAHFLKLAASSNPVKVGQLLFSLSANITAEAPFVISGISKTGIPNIARACNSNSVKFCVPAKVTIPVSCGLGESSEK
jgi:hypothetical protein